MTARYRATLLGHTVRVVDCFEHEPADAPDMCVVGNIPGPYSQTRERPEVVWARAHLIADALNALDAEVEVLTEALT